MGGFFKNDCGCGNDCTWLIILLIILCVSVKVLPEPAAALTSRVRPRASIAACCAFVKFIKISISPYSAIICDQ